MRDLQESDLCEIVANNTAHMFDQGTVVCVVGVRENDTGPVYSCQGLDSTGTYRAWWCWRQDLQFVSRDETPVL